MHRISSNFKCRQVAGPGEHIRGVKLRSLGGVPDARGLVSEVFREGWDTGLNPVQWTLMASGAGVLRGMHVHTRHSDYVTALSGRCTVALCDLREESPTQGVLQVFEACGDEPVGVTIPNGVLHGFYYPTDSVQILGTSHVYDPDDDLGCHWDDPELGIAWPTTAPKLSARDERAGSLRELLEEIASRSNR